MISYREKEMMVAMKYMADHTSRFAETAVEASLCMFSRKNIDGTVEILPEVTSFEDIIRNARENGYDTSIGIEELLSPEELKRLEEEYESIDNEFSELTKLNKMDIGFVVIAVALQLLRQVLQPKLDFGSFTDLKNRQDHTQTAKEAKKYFDKEKADKILEKAQKDAVKASRYYFATISEVADISYVPYDVVNGTAKFSVGLNGKNHRAKTLGHDPYLGYFFGICNILTNTMSLGKDNLFRTLHIGKDVSGRRAAIAEADLLLMLKHSFERFKESKETIVLAFLKQKYHIESDELSKEGLPLPFLQLLFDTDVITALCESGIDYAKLNFFGTVGEQAILDEFINFIISVAHRINIICEENKQLGKEKLISKDEIIGSLKKNQTINEVRTRKIILISDSIATYINAKVIIGVEAAAILTENAELAKKGLKYMDLGGYITTIIHLISDTRFIAKVKKDFVNQAVDQNFREKMEELLSE